jgi:hypothetical protein
MTASGLPAVLIKLAISADPTVPSCAVFGMLDLEEIAEMAESIDEFRGGFPAGSARAFAGPGMMEGRLEGGPPGGCAATRGSETLRTSFGKRSEWGDGAGPGFVASGVVFPEESLSKYVFSDGSERWSSGAAVVTMRGTAAEEESGKGESVESGLAGTRLDLMRTKRLDQYCGHHGRRHESVVAPLRKCQARRRRQDTGQMLCSGNTESARRGSWWIVYVGG